MKKKILSIIIAVMTAALVLVGCSDGKTDPLDNVGGQVVSGNGTFLVEKGDYLYFVNGEDSTSSTNDFGTPVKSSLVRVKKTDLDNPSAAKVETVVPKIMLTGSFSTGVYFYGDYVYYATPSTEKDKTGTVQNSETEFNRLNLKTGKADSAIAISEDNTAQFFYTEVDGVVYLFYTFSEKVDSSTENKFKVINATTGDDVYTSDAYTSLAFPSDSSKTAFFVKTAYSNELEQSESFSELYAYTAGESEAKLVLSGTGSFGLGRDNRQNDLSNLQLISESGYEGVTISIIKNTGKYLIYKITTLDSTYASNVYYGAEIENGGFKTVTYTEGSEQKQKVAEKLGDSNAVIDNAITANSHYVSLECVYYIDSTYGLIKFDYKNGPADTFGAEIISTDLKNLTIISIDGDYMYLCNTSEGFYFRINLTDTEIEKKQINALAMQTPTDFYSPRIIDNRYFIGSYSHEVFYKYVYVIDMKDIDTPKAEGEDLSKYEKYLEDAAELNRENILSLKDTLLGKTTDADKTSFDEYLDKNYPEK